MDGNANHAREGREGGGGGGRERGWKMENGAYNAPEKVQLRRVTYAGKSGHEVTRVINPFAPYFTRGDARARHYFQPVFSPDLTARLRPISGPLALGPPFGKPFLLFPRSRMCPR